MRWLIEKVLEFLMRREEKYKPRHTLCALFGFWISTPTKREGFFLVKYVEVYWGLFPYLAGLSSRLLGSEKYALKKRLIFRDVIRKDHFDQKIREIQDFFDSGEYVYRKLR
jgi:hypothetical protein